MALVQISICVWSPLLPASDVVSGLPDHNTAPLPQSICSTYTPTIHTIALHTTWRLLCTLQIIQHISRLHRSLRSPPHPSGNHLCFWDDRLVGLQPSGTADLTLSDQPNYLISAFKAVDLHAVSVITADRCSIRSLIMESTRPALVLWSHPRLHTPPHFSSTSPWGLEPLYSPLCSIKGSNQLLLTSNCKIKDAKREKQSDFPSLFHLSIPLLDSLQCLYLDSMFPFFLASHLAPDAAQ